MQAQLRAGRAEGIGQMVDISIRVQRGVGDPQPFRSARGMVG
jgi:hypothetical protein